MRRYVLIAYDEQLCTCERMLINVQFLYVLDDYTNERKSKILPGATV